VSVALPLATGVITPFLSTVNTPFDDVYISL